MIEEAISSRDDYAVPWQNRTFSFQDFLSAHPFLCLPIALFRSLALVSFSPALVLNRMKYNYLQGTHEPCSSLVFLCSELWAVLENMPSPGCSKQADSGNLSTKGCQCSKSIRSIKQRLSKESAFGSREKLTLLAHFVCELETTWKKKLWKEILPFSCLCPFNYLISCVAIVLTDAFTDVQEISLTSSYLL